MCSFSSISLSLASFSFILRLSKGFILFSICINFEGCCEKPDPLQHCALSFSNNVLKSIRQQCSCIFSSVPSWYGLVGEGYVSCSTWVCHKMGENLCQVSNKVKGPATGYWAGYKRWWQEWNAGHSSEAEVGLADKSECSHGKGLHEMTKASYRI